MQSSRVCRLEMIGAGMTPCSRPCQRLAGLVGWSAGCREAWRQVVSSAFGRARDRRLRPSEDQKQPTNNCLSLDRGMSSVIMDRRRVVGRVVGHPFSPGLDLGPRRCFGVRRPRGLAAGSRGKNAAAWYGGTRRYTWSGMPWS